MPKISRKSRRWVVLLLIALSCAANTSHAAAAANATTNNNATNKKKPILLMGLPRSGSETIHAFLQCMGITTAHHYCCDTTTTTNRDARTRFPCADRTCAACLQRNLLLQHSSNNDPFHGCSSSTTTTGTASTTPIVYTAFDEESSSSSAKKHDEEDPYYYYSWFLPQHFALPLLHESTGTWIVNTVSNADTWATHILHWYSLTRRLFHAFDVPYYHGDDDDDDRIADSSAGGARTTPTTTRGVIISVEASLARARNTTEHERRHAALVALYQRHTDRVVAFAQEYRHPYILLTVDDANDDSVVQQLAGALGLPEYHRASDCWKVDPHYGDDWKDIRLPF